MSWHRAAKGWCQELRLLLDARREAEAIEDRIEAFEDITGVLMDPCPDGCGALWPAALLDSLNAPGCPACRPREWRQGPRARRREPAEDVA